MVAPHVGTDIWMLVHICVFEHTTSKSPRVQRAQSLKQAEKHSESQRNPESLRNLSESFSESESFRARQFRVLMHLGYIHLFRELRRASESFRAPLREFLRVREL